MSARRILVLCVMAPVLAALGVVAAWAFWTTPGSGTASASTAKINPPSSVTATSTPGSGTVPVSWTNSALSGGGITPSGYYVTRVRNSDSQTVAACGSAANPTASSPCVDSGVPDGTYHYVVTAVRVTWTAGAPSGSVTVVNDNTAPTATSVISKDADGNGKLDQIVVTFSEALATYSAGTTPWSLAGAPVGVGAAPKSVSVSGTQAILLLNEANVVDTVGGGLTVSLASNANGIRDAAGNLSSFAPVAVSDGMSPVKTAMTMFDSDANGKVDRVTVTYSETLAATPTGTWSLASVPSSGTLGTPTIAGSSNKVLLPIAEGASFPNTAVGAFTVALSDTGPKDAAGNTAATFTATAPADGAAPVKTAMTMLDNNGNGKVDGVNVTFSESLVTSTATSPPWTLASVPSMGSLASVSTTGSTATLVLSEGVGAADTSVGSFTVALAASATGIKDATGNQSSITATAPADGAAPVRTALTMLDSNGNGRVDRVTATYSENLLTPLGAWTLAGIPSAGIQGTTTVATNVVTVPITEGAGAADTSVGSLTVALSGTGPKDSAGNTAAPFAATAPADGAGPVALSLATADVGGAAGKAQSNDTVTVTFSEPLLATSVTSQSPVTVTLTGGPGNAAFTTLNIPGVTAPGGFDTGAAYVKHDQSYSFTGSVLSLQAANQVRVTLGTGSGNATNLQTIASASSFTYVPATTITDSASNSPAGSLPQSLRLF